MLDSVLYYEFLAITFLVKRKDSDDTHKFIVCTKCIYLLINAIYRNSTFPINISQTLLESHN